MIKNRNAYIFIAVFISGFLTLGIASNCMECILFDQISYNYISYLSMPPNHPNESSIGGYYKIYGKGSNFNFCIVLPGAEDQESPLDYTANGLNGTGKINDIDITYGTIVSLLAGDFKNALFNTKINGNYTMACAAWIGYGNFTNNGQNFIGNFKINGVKTDWEGTFNLVPENNKIALKADYIWYHHANKNDGSIKKVKKTYYM